MNLNMASFFNTTWAEVSFFSFVHDMICINHASGNFVVRSHLSLIDHVAKTRVADKTAFYQAIILPVTIAVATFGGLLTGSVARKIKVLDIFVAHEKIACSIMSLCTSFSSEFDRT
jgi:predicted nucleotidyltransferase